MSPVDNVRQVRVRELTAGDVLAGTRQRVIRNRQPLRGERQCRLTLEPGGETMFLATTRVWIEASPRPPASGGGGTASAESAQCGEEQPRGADAQLPQRGGASSSDPLGRAATPRTWWERHRSAPEQIDEYQTWGDPDPDPQLDIYDPEATR